MSHGFRKKTARRVILLAVAFAGLLLRPLVAQKELIFRLDTGGDDLRGGNDNVHLLILLDTGAQLRFENVNDLRRWGNNSTVRISRPFPAALEFHNIVGVRLETTFGGGIAGDNWNLDRLEVRARLDSETRVLFAQSGAPLFRFTGEQRVREFRFPVDFDQDGLSDDWESTESHLGLSPLRANLILVPVIRPNMVRDQVQPALDKVVDFFARIPNRNPDGSTGIGVVLQWGNPLPDIDSDAPGRTPPDYLEVRTRGIPAALVGKGHGVLIGTGTQGGGQTIPLSDWSGSSNNWHTIVHELGHQLGLDHEPRGTGIPSPLYTSIMNYDYNYEFNGDPNAVHFSQGRFRSAFLNERNLNELLLFPPADLTFLSRAPYRFELRPAPLGTTHVDFNRNGVFGERGIRTDINGGSAITARDRVDFKEAAGGFALATFGDRLVAVYSALNPPGGWINYTQTGLSLSNPGGLKYQIYTGGQAGPALNLVTADVTGDPHAIEAFGRLFVAFPTARGYNVYSYRQGSLADRLQVDGFTGDNTSGQPLDPVLIRTSDPEELYVFAWDRATRGVRYRKVSTSAASGWISLGPAEDLRTERGTLVSSNSPVGGVWDPTIGEMALVTTERSDRFQGQMKMIQLSRSGTGWQVRRDRWVMGEGNPVATLSRPTVLFDGRPSAGRTGQYLIYSRWEDSGSSPVPTELIRMTRGDTTERWTVQLMQNGWTTTRSAPSATLYRDDIAWGWRVNESFPGVPNILQIFLRASGITDSGMTDHDDVTWIATRGLRESLQSVAR